MTATRDWESERSIIEAHAGGRMALIAGSFARVTGGQLVPEAGDFAGALWSLPAVVVAHATEDDPIFFYANRAALALFEAGAEDFIRMPSRYSAEPLERGERARLFERVAAYDFIDDYRGVRISTSGRRFRIEQATVWNLVNADGAIHGQAACFSRWIVLD